MIQPAFQINIVADIETIHAIAGVIVFVAGVWLANKLIPFVFKRKTA